MARLSLWLVSFSSVAWVVGGKLHVRCQCLPSFFGRLGRERRFPAAYRRCRPNLLLAQGNFYHHPAHDVIDLEIVFRALRVRIVAMQACARIGAIHSVVFGGFSAQSVRDRINDAGAIAVITMDEQCRGGKKLPLKPAVDEGIALGGCETIKTVIVFKRTGGACNMVAGRDVWWDDVIAGQSDVCEPEWVEAEHPLFLLYTSGSTGKPKGVQHSTGGYLLHAILTMKWTFDLKPNDLFWCTAE